MATTNWKTYAPAFRRTNARRNRRKVESSQSCVWSRGLRVASFKSFEEIHAWQKAREATRRVYEITADKRFGRAYGLSNQIQRASVSIMANIAEGFGRHSDKEFANFL